jgi:hypothetical protein
MPEMQPTQPENKKWKVAAVAKTEDGQEEQADKAPTEETPCNGNSFAMAPTIRIGPMAPTIRIGLNTSTSTTTDNRKADQRQRKVIVPLKA